MAYSASGPTSLPSANMRGEMATPVYENCVYQNRRGGDHQPSDDVYAKVRERESEGRKTESEEELRERVR